jgi:hypothetical protein
LQRGHDRKWPEQQSSITTTQMKYTKMVKRSPTHVIDTRAVRNVLVQLPDSLLMRSLDERDYGIDIMMEVFDGEYPTGHFVLVQVKGVDAPLRGRVKLRKFPVKTLLYAELFEPPFFVFYSPANGGDVYFVWLQRYIKAKLDHDLPTWRTRKTLTIYFPADNVLRSNSGRIVEIAKRNALKMAGISFLAAYESLKLHSRSLLSGALTDFAAGATHCISYLPDVRDFLKRRCELGDPTFEIDLKELEDTFCLIKSCGYADEETTATIERELCKLEGLKMTYLSSDELDRFAVEESDAYPY